MANLIVPTTFTAIDKMSAVMQKMTAATTTFGNKAAGAMRKVESAEKSLFGSIERNLGKLGIGLSLLAIGTTVINSQLQAEKAMASLSAITGVTGAEFKKFEAEISRVSKAQFMFSGDTAKAFEIIGSAKSDLLGNAKALSMVAEQAIILSKATGDDLQTAAGSLTSTLNQFSLGAERAGEVINILAAGSLAGAANVPLISQAMDKFGTAAASLNVSVAESVGLIETLAEKNLMGADAGTALRNVLIKMGTAAALPAPALEQLKKYGVNIKKVMDNTIPLNERLKEFSKISGDATAIAKVFGSENFVAGQILLQNVGTVDRFTRAVTGTNTANDQAAIMSNTVANKLIELKNAFANATTTTDSNNVALTFAKDTLGFLAKNMDTVIGATLLAAGAFASYKLIVGGVTLATWLYNTALDFMLLKQGYQGVALLSGKTALFLYTAAQNIATAAAWAFGIAVQVGIWPLTLIALGIAAVVALIWKWKSVSKWFSTNFIPMIKEVGRNVLEFILMPIKMVLKLLSMVPGAVGKFAGKGLTMINEFTNPLNADATIEKVRTERYENYVTKNSTLTIDNKTGYGTSINGNDPNIYVTNTLGWNKF